MNTDFDLDADAVSFQVFNKGSNDMDNASNAGAKSSMYYDSVLIF